MAKKASKGKPSTMSIRSRPSPPPPKERARGCRLSEGICEEWRRLQIPKTQDRRHLQLPEGVDPLPHPDDDVLGCGGIIGLCSEKGVQVKVVYMTDGRHGNNKIPTEELIRIRRAEARAALKTLGYSDAVFLNNMDTALEPSPENVRAVLEIVKEFRPDAVFFPSFDELPPDHFNTARIAAQVALRVRRKIDWFGYEVWCPFILCPYGRFVLVDIGSTIEKKKQAINMHRSQTEVNDYAPKILGLNAYRSMLAQKGVYYCEAFMMFDRKELLDKAWEHGAFEGT